jgi:hypothetical protein
MERRAQRRSSLGSVAPNKKRQRKKNRRGKKNKEKKKQSVGDTLKRHSNDTHKRKGRERKALMWVGMPAFFFFLFSPAKAL